MDDDIIVVKNVRLRFLSSKLDKYDNQISYFRIDKNSISKFSVINNVGFNLPYFETTDGKHLLKVKSKYVKINDLKNDIVISCDLSFKHYKFEGVEGYYVNKLA